MIRRGCSFAPVIAVLAAALALAVCPRALAGQLVTLRTDLSSGARITLGDLFDGAGVASAVVVGAGAPEGERAVLDAAAVGRIAREHDLDWDNAGQIRLILVRRGAAEARTAEALTYARPMAAGEIVQPQDVIFSKIAVNTLPSDAPRAGEPVVGMMTRRSVRVGAPVAAHDLVPAQVIKRDDVVEVAYNAGGVNLVLQGKAMGAAGLGEPVAIQNTLSKKIIQAVAVGPDQAIVGPDTEHFRAAAAPVIGPARFAAIR